MDVNGDSYGLPAWIPPLGVFGILVGAALFLYRAIATGKLIPGSVVDQMRAQYEASIVRIREDLTKRAEVAEDRERKSLEANEVLASSLKESNQAVQALTTVGETANDLIRALRRTVDGDPR